MISLCASADGIGPLRSSKERLQEELAARDAVIEALTRQMELLQRQREKKKRSRDEGKPRKQSLIQSIARRFSLHQYLKSGRERCVEDTNVWSATDSNYNVVVIDKTAENKTEQIPRTKSVTAIDNLLYSSHSIWNLSSSSTNLLLYEQEEYTLEDILSGKSKGSIRLDNEGCMLVYGCPKELVHLLDADYVAERERRWLLRHDFIDSLTGEQV